MSKQPVSVNLSTDNILWLRKQAMAKNRSLSKALDDLIHQARSSGPSNDHTIRSVVGTIEIDPSAPDLLEADSFVRSLFHPSTGKPRMKKKTGRAKRDSKR
ncbi:MAG: hypothetical protein AB1631_24190 [Acidobacteriota bacterium]